MRLKHLFSLSFLLFVSAISFASSTVIDSIQIQCDSPVLAEIKYRTYGLEITDAQYQQIVSGINQRNGQLQALGDSGNLSSLNAIMHNEWTAYVNCVGMDKIKKKCKKTNKLVVAQQVNTFVNQNISNYLCTDSLGLAKKMKAYYNELMWINLNYKYVPSERGKKLAIANIKLFDALEKLKLHEAVVRKINNRYSFSDFTNEQLRIINGVFLKCQLKNISVSNSLNIAFKQILKNENMANVESKAMLIKSGKQADNFIKKYKLPTECKNELKGLFADWSKELSTVKGKSKQDAINRVYQYKRGELALKYEPANFKAKQAQKKYRQSALLNNSDTLGLSAEQIDKWTTYYEEFLGKPGFTGCGNLKTHKAKLQEILTEDQYTTLLTLYVKPDVNKTCIAKLKEYQQNGITVDKSLHSALNAYITSQKVAAIRYVDDPVTRKQVMKELKQNRNYQLKAMERSLIKKTQQKEGSYTGTYQW